MKFTEAKLEEAFIELLDQQGYDYVSGKSIHKAADEVVLKEDLKEFLNRQYKADNITKNEVEQIVQELLLLPASDLYESNKTFMKKLSDGFEFKREDRSQKDIWIYLIDYSKKNNNTYKFVNQLEIHGSQPPHRIPDGIVYVNGLPLVVIEFKSAIVEDATIYDAFKQLTIRYERDIPEL